MVEEDTWLSHLGTDFVCFCPCRLCFSLPNLLFDVTGTKTCRKEGHSFSLTSSTSSKPGIPPYIYSRLFDYTICPPGFSVACRSEKGHKVTVTTGGRNLSNVGLSGNECPSSGEETSARGCVLPSSPSNSETARDL